MHTRWIALAALALAVISSGAHAASVTFGNQEGGLIEGRGGAVAMGKPGRAERTHRMAQEIADGEKFRRGGGHGGFPLWR